MEGQFSGGHEDQSLDISVFQIDVVDDGDEESCGLTGSIFGTSYDALPQLDLWNYFFLDGRRLIEVFGDDSFDEIFLQFEICPVQILNLLDVVSCRWISNVGTRVLHYEFIF